MVQNSYITISTNKNITIAVFSDIHFCKNYPLKRLQAIYSSLKKHQPNYICIVGDLLDTAIELENNELKNFFTNWLQKIASLAPIMIAIGNHDVTVWKNKRCYYRFPKELIEEISLIPNVFVLDNKATIKDGICFYGYTPPHAYYDSGNMEKVGAYAEDIEEKLDPSLTKGKYTVLLCHSPLYVTDKNVRFLPLLRSTQLVLSGHMHNGLIPFFKKGNFGLIAPSKKWFPKYARGHFQLNKIHYVISGGVITFSNSAPSFLHVWNFIYPVHIDYVTI